MDHAHEILIGLTGVFALGIGAQWLAWRLRVPSILLLLAFGFLAGPVTGFLDPDKLLGDLLFPITSLSVALILFEGGLTLRFPELRETGGAVRNLCSLGAGVTWVLASIAAHRILGFDIPTALVLGAILTVTGPTVIGPLLSHIQPVGRAAAIAKWEGIIIDPVGAVLAVLVFNATDIGTADGFQAAGLHAFIEFAKTAAAGGLTGGAVAWLTIQLMKRFWAPDFLEIPLLVTLVTLAFTIAQTLQHESGLIAVTLMGIVLANQKKVNIRHVLEFKENLRVLLISALFILLAARLRTDLSAILDWRNFVFLGALILVIRPASVFLSTIGSGLNWKEKLFLSWLAPRGIVAAAVASVFALELESDGDRLVQTVFLVIVGTVSVYGLTAAALARRLGISHPNPQGVLIVGAHPFARALGKVLQEVGFPVLLSDPTRGRISRARMEGLPTYYGSVLAETSLHEMDLGGIGKMIALTPNDELNALAARHCDEAFERSEIYQLPSEGHDKSPDASMAKELKSRILFDPSATYYHLEGRLAMGGVVKKTNLTDEFDYGDFREEYGENALPLFLAKPSGDLVVCALDNRPEPASGDTLIFLTG